MIIGIIYGVGYLSIKSNLRSKYGISTFVFVITLIILTHISRLFWLVEVENKFFKWSYLIKWHNFNNTFNAILVSGLIGGLIAFIWWLIKASKKQLKRVGLVFILISTVFVSGFYFFFSRDISKNEIYLDYSITSLEKIKELAKTKKKVLYVDIWHSGCKPCLEEFGRHNQFTQRIDDDKVHLLFIGVDRSVPGEKQKQRIIIEKYGLKGTHSFISRETFIEILNNAGYNDEIHGYKAFPHHMIIGPNGEIIEVKAQSPSNNLATKLNGIKNQVLVQSE
ncbi:TlpA family protein disulfide reductase [Marinigracilibium pacificum]|uniref:Thioredoxin domain-containing protein n=1 Tax=Marinigracilibium pacificum TaxID=2729599 RepID=A0A848ITD4_9BACT|nr:hypothetical protein [Marinigracilibium pacificum]NMM47733.1 hypothetical protein [Marinigracilibium pacificum]